MAALRIRLAVALGVCALVALTLVVRWPDARPAQANPLTGIASVDGSAFNTCVVTTTGGVKCWGKGYGSIPVPVSGLASGVIAVGVGEDHRCALTTAGGVKCWGGNGFGQLGDGSFSSSPTPVDVVGLSSGVTAIAVGHSCALLSTSALKCWGSNTWGELGNGTNGVANSPQDVTGLTSGVAAIDVNGEHSCAVLSSGAMKCWGLNGAGQLGDGTLVNQNTPVNVVGISSAVAASNGATHTCARLAAATVSCWGAGFGGIAVAVSGFSSVTTLVSGESFLCALAGGGLKCQGKSDQGQLGDGQACGTACTAPVNVMGLSGGVVKVAAGLRHACAVTSGGGVKCWGWNAFEQIGDATAITRYVPVDVVTTSIKPTATNTPCAPVGCPTVTATATPGSSSGVDFSIGIDADGNGADGCDTKGGPTKCAVSAGGTFTLKVYLNSLLPPPFQGYAGFDIRLNYIGVASKNNVSAAAWPSCAYLGHAPFGPGTVIWGCASGSGVSTYLGQIASDGFNCLAAGTITLVHGSPNTSIHDIGGNPYSEPRGTTETLAINCPTPTATRSPTATPTATNTRPPPALGGVAQYPDVASGHRTGLIVAFAAALAALAAAAALRLTRRRIR